MNFLYITRAIPGFTKNYSPINRTQAALFAIQKGITRP
jgi:hypothetical protein